TGGDGNYHPEPGLQYTGKGGTQSAGGVGSTQATPATNGGFGYGGNGGINTDGHKGGGGGGGYFGGGGSVWHAGAGGGSSFISGYTGCNAVDANGSFTGQPNHHSGYVFANASMTQGGRVGNGAAVFQHITSDEFGSNNENIVFGYNGYGQTYTITRSGEYQVTLYGASGGNSYTAANWGTGGSVTGRIYLSSGTEIHVFVGGAGEQTTIGGFNGGGSTSGTVFGGGGGGGATDIRIGGTALVDRIMVAGGGGGHNDSACTLNNGYGRGGAFSGGDGNNHPSVAPTAAMAYGKGGSQTAGGAGGIVDAVSGVAGSFGYGGNGNPRLDGHAGGGGGGGYYGGGGSVWHAGGGGGSSFISGYAGCNAVNQSGTPTGSANHFSGYTFFNASMTAGGRIGNGYAVLTPISLDETAPSVPTLTPSRASSSGYYYNSVDIEISGSIDNTGGTGFDHYEYKIGDGAWTTGSTATLSSSLTTGTETITLSVRAYDKVNNYSTASISCNFDRTLYTLTYHNATASFINPNPASYHVETETFNLQNITRTGFAFGGFYTDSGLTSPASTTITKGSRINKQFYVKFTLNAPTASVPTVGSTTYGTPKTLTATPSHANSSVAYHYQWQMKGPADASFADIPSANSGSYQYPTSGAGVYQFRVRVWASLDGYTSSSAYSNNLALTVNRKNIEVFATAITRTYGDPLVTSYAYTTSDDFVGGDTALNGVLDCPGLIQAADAYFISIGTLNNANNPNYNIIYTGANYTILRKDITVTAIGVNKVYGDPLVTSYSYTTSDDFVNGDTALNGAPACPTLVQAADSYPIEEGTLTNANNPNYNILFTGADYVITRKPITVTANTINKIYGETLLTSFGYTLSDDLVNGDTGLEGDLTCPSLVQYTGSYPILQGTVDNAHNPDYDISYIGANYHISKFDIKADPIGLGKVYGEAEPVLEETILTGISGESVIVIYTRDAGEAAASYDLTTVVLKEAQDNYTVSFAAGGYQDKFVIARRPLTITADAVNKIYGDLLVYSFTYQITSGTLSGTDTLTGELACPTLVQAAGDYPITQNTLNNMLNPNYDISYLGANYRIARANIVVEVPSATYFKTFAENDPLLLLEVDGVNSETFSVIFTRETVESAGVYDIIGVNSQNDNYAVSLAVGTGADKFEIFRRPVSVTADATGHIYGNADAALTYNVSNLPQGYTLSGALQREAGSDYKADGYTITQGTLTNANNPDYLITFTEGIYTIAKRPITVTAIDTGHIYGESDAALSFDSGDIVTGDTLAGVLQREAGTDWRAQGYAITQGTVVNANNPNYNITFVNGVYTIHKRALSVEPIVYTKIYGDPNPDFVQTVGGIPGEQVMVTYTVAAVTHVGSYPLTGIGTTDTNYSVTIATGCEADKFVIERRPITITAIATGHVFGDDDAPLQYQVSNMVTGDTLSGALIREEGYEYKADGYAILQGSLTNGNNPDYDIVLYTDAIYMITKRPVTVYAIPTGHTYGEADADLFYESANTVEGTPLIGTLTREPGTHWKAEGYIILQDTLTDENNPNYVITYNSAIYTVFKRAITVTAENKTITYGDLDVALTYLTQNLVAGDTLTGDLQRVAGSGWRPEGYVIGQGTLTNANNTDYDIDFVEGLYFIEKRVVSVTPDLFTKYYGEEDPALEQIAYGIPGESFVVVFVRSDPTQHDAGNYNITAVVSVDNNNYTATIAAGTGIAKMRILPKDITVLAESSGHQYGAEDAPLSFIISDTTPLAYGETTLQGALTREQGNEYRENGYRILQGTVTNTRNPNYNITYVENIYTIYKRPITIAATARMQVYGDPEISLEYVFTEGSLLEGDMLTGTLIRDPGTTVGGYAIKQGSLNNPNYEISFIEGVYTISRAPITVTADPKSIIYGEPDLPLTYRESPALYGDDTFSGELTREEGTDANETGYNILLGSLNNPNYEITFISAKYTIYKRDISITANNRTQVYGEPDTTLTYTITEGSEAFEDDLNGSLQRTWGIDYKPEGYDILQGTLTNANNPNYNITFRGAKYFIQKRPITVTADDKTQIYGEAAIPLTYTVTEGELAYDDALTGALQRENGNSARTYTIMGGTLINASLNPNYTLRFFSGTYTITPRPITVEAEEKTIIYGDPNVPLTYTITQGNMVGGDYLYNTLTREEGNGAGRYEIGGADLYNPNYNISYIAAEYVIQRRPIAVYAQPTVFTYGDIPLFAYETQNIVEGDILNGSPDIAGNDAGSYQIHQGTLTNANNPNYDITFTEASCTVLQRPVTVTLGAQSSEYGAPIKVNSDAYFVTSGTVVGEDDLGITIQRLSQGTFIGDYPLRATYTNTNYIVEIVDASYTITKIRPTITVNERQVELVYTGKPYHIAASIDSHAQIIYRKNGEMVENSFVDAGTHSVTLTAADTDIFSEPIPVTVQIIIKPTSLSTQTMDVEVYRAEGFDRNVYLEFEEITPTIDAGTFLTRTERLSNTYSLNLSGDTDELTNTVRVKVPDELASLDRVKLLVTEGETTRVLYLTPSAEGTVSFTVNGPATVSFISPVKTTSFLTIALTVVGSMVLIFIVFSFIKGARTSGRGR
ncbi:MAG: MBG domain-containing protein, partial [Clostridia bacterium]|nr:MBG domain-containing protein [Clostridia bacterium]